MSDFEFVDQLPDFSTVKQFAEVVNASESTVRGWIKQGYLPAIRWGRVWRIPKGPLEKLRDGYAVDKELGQSSASMDRLHASGLSRADVETQSSPWQSARKER